MKTLWSTLSFLAVVNLLAMLLFIGWLFQSGRLTGDRVQEIRSMLAKTVAEEQAARAQAAEAAQEQADAAAEQVWRDNPPAPSAQQVAMLVSDDEIAAHANRRLMASKEQLLQQLSNTMAQLDAKEQELDTLRTGWDAATRAARDRSADEQFQKAVKLLESLNSKQAKGMMLDLVQNGQTDQAVAYLDAMNQRAATKIVSELTSDSERQLATELLERLRTLGTIAEGGANHADAAVPDDSGNETSDQP